jgi:hypothetical protein
MKVIVFGICVLFSLPTFAQCRHNQEALLMPTNVKKVVMHESGCRVIPERGESRSNDLCPIDDSGIMSRGIEVGFNIKKECNYNVGDPISGVIFNTGNNDLGLELEGPRKFKPEDCEIEAPELAEPKKLSKDWDEVKEKLEEVR